MPFNVSQNQLESPFDKIRHVDEYGEYWLSRELQPALGYKTWREFNETVEKAKISCQNVGTNPDDHFVLGYKMIKAGKGAQRKVEDYRLTRHACYMTAMNGNPRIQEVSLAQSYFASQTYFAENVQKALATEAHQRTLPQHKFTDLLAERAKINTSRVPTHYFGVLTHLFYQLHTLERWVDDLDEKATLEISVGIRWKQYADEVLRIPSTDMIKYSHILPNGRIEKVWAYAYKWGEEFDKWIWTVYFPEKYPAYIQYRKTKLALPAPKKPKQIKGK
jgi:hypothetical protein